MSAPASRIPAFEGETPLQVLAHRDGGLEPTALTSIERFPYYTAFPFAWYMACYADEVAPGEVRSYRYLARDLVVWRGQDGRPHVMDAYCPHLGANIAYGGRVEGDHLVCPFHWWEYDGEGRNVRIPYSDRTNDRARLRSYPTVERNGLILFWYHPTGEPPMWEIPQLKEYGDPAWGEYLRTDWKVRCPWQEMAENGPDYIHLRTVHGAADVPELEELSYDGWLSRVRSTVTYSTPRGPQPGRIDTDSWGPGYAVARFTGIHDTIFVGSNTPIDWEWTLSVKAYLFRQGDTPEEAERAGRVGAAVVEDLRKQMREDNVIFDNKVFLERPALASADGPIMEFRRWAEQFYVDGDPLAAGRVRP